MNLRIIDVWAVFTSNSEYGYPDKLIGIYSTKQEANRMAQGRGWWGGEGPIEKRKALIINDNPCTVYLLDSKTDNYIQIGSNLIEDKKLKKKRALAKLTDEDKQLLGIEE